MKINKNGVFYYKDQKDNIHFKYNVDSEMAYELHVPYDRYRKVLKNKSMQDFNMSDFHKFDEYETYFDGELSTLREDLKKRKSME